MAPLTPVALTAHSIQLNSNEFTTISNWPYEDEFVARLLRDDVRMRLLLGLCRVFLYRDPKGQPVGFGALDICDEYGSLTRGAPHPYIPLLAVNPTIKSLGYGTSILRHLVDESAVLASRAWCAKSLFLEVYKTSVKAHELYRRAGFLPVGDEQFDPVENEHFLVMAKRRHPVTNRSRFASRGSSDRFPLKTAKRVAHPPRAPECAPFTLAEQVSYARQIFH